MGEYGLHFWMSDISRYPGYAEGINSHSFEGFPNFFRRVCGGSGMDCIAITLLLCELWGGVEKGGGGVPTRLGGGWIQFAEDMWVLSE